MNTISVAIDGPVGAGKSSIARECAKKLGFIYVDTGALYRSIGLYCVNSETDMDNVKAVTDALSGIKLEIKLINGTQHVYLNGKDVSEEIRLPEISMAASRVSAIPSVRTFLLGLQRDLASSTNVIMDGRDIGTVVLPNATVKIYLTAKAEVRAKRRYDELIAKGIESDFDEVLRELNQRDYNDMNRAVAPLCKAEDAVLIDTTELDFNGSVEAIIEKVKQK